MSAQPDCNLKSRDSIQHQALTLFELQTIFNYFTQVNHIDPCSNGLSDTPQVGNFLTSTPFHQIDSFEGFCQHILFPYLLVTENRVGKHIIDFNDSPQGILVEPMRIGFLMKNFPSLQDHQENVRTIQAEVPSVIHQNDQIQGGENLASTIENNEARQNGRFDATLNCDLDIFPISDQIFKVVIIPCLDLQSYEIQLRMGNEVTQSMQSSFHQPQIGAIQIDLQFKSRELVQQFFAEIDEPQLKFGDSQKADYEIKSFQTIEKPMTFFNTKLRPYVMALDKYLQKEFDDWLYNECQDLRSDDNQNTQSTNKEVGEFNSTKLGTNQGDQRKQLLNDHQRLLNVITGQRIVYCRLNIGEKIPNAEKDKDPKKGHYKAEMMVVTRKDEIRKETQQKEHVPVQNDLKFVVLYCSTGEIKESEMYEFST